MQLAERFIFVGNSPRHASSPLVFFEGKINPTTDAEPAQGDSRRDHLAQESPLFRENELVFLGSCEILHSLFIGPKPCAVFFVSRKAFKGNQREGDVVGALMRHPVTDEIAAAFRNDGKPALCIFLEQRALERIDLVANKNRDSHGETPDLQPSLRGAKRRSNPESACGSPGLLRLRSQ